MKVAVVTGSNKGIGFAIVRALCKKFDGDVYLTSRDEGRGKDAVETLKCHERIDEYNELRQEARLWIEGILLLIFGIFGIFGNIVSIIVLPRCPGNRNFNVLLM